MQKLPEATDACPPPKEPFRQKEDSHTLSVATSVMIIPRSFLLTGGGRRASII